MNRQSPTAFHSVGEEWLASYSAGGLSHAKRLLIACQATLKPELSSRLATLDAVGGALLESARGEAVSGDFFSRVMGKIEAEQDSVALNVNSEAPPTKIGIPPWSPPPLDGYLKRLGKTPIWKKLGFGLERASLHTNDNEDLYLLKTPPGLKVPEHTHDGEEWALILQGGYHVGETSYAVGDLHREDETCTHAPIVDNEGEACITLVAIEGGLKFSNPMMRLLKPIIGI